jgi:plastocyanin
MRKRGDYGARPMQRLSVLLPFLVALAACSSTETGAPGSTTATTTVNLTATAFEPATITIKAGDTVTWKWTTGTHDVESGTACTPDGKFSSGDPVAGGTFEHKFDAAGTYDYFCSVHCADGMVGKVIVQ